MYLQWTIGTLTSLEHADTLSRALEAVWSRVVRREIGQAPLWGPKLLGLPRALSLWEYSFVTALIDTPRMRCAMGPRVAKPWWTLGTMKQIRGVINPTLERSVVFSE